LNIGMTLIHGLLEEEADRVVGPKSKPLSERQAYRWGKEDSYVIYGGMKVPFERPRVRSVDGEEIPLERLQSFQDKDSIQDKVAGRVLSRVSMRDYEGTVDELAEGYGIRKSSVSRHWKVESAKRLKELMERPLGELDLTAIMVDGIVFHSYTLVVALGFASDGMKHVLGLWAGATENSDICKALFDELISRGLSTERRYLFVLDGSKALNKAVRDYFGERGIIQRCQLHKERNVLSHLPDAYHAAARLKLRAAWGMKDYDKAKTALRNVVEYLENISPSAARSLEEAFEETLTVHRLKLSQKLRHTFRSTNPIENLFSRYADLCRNVKHWKNEDMAKRWGGTVLLKAEEKFRRIQGYKDMHQLVDSLATVDAVRIPA
jgi:transposase-like protein